jgi:1,4-alpha-glucan branching enzyme
VHELKSIVVKQHICGDVEFSFYRREARAVFLCGDFNAWWQTTLPMTRVDDGWWKCRLRLAPGCYQFKYLADSEWYLDYAAFGMERNPLGGWNSVVLVSEEPGDAEPRRALAADIAMPMQLSEAIFGHQAPMSW